MAAGTSLTHDTVQRVVAERRHMAGALLPVLHGIQDALGFIPPDAVPLIADGLNLSRAEVHGVISFLSPLPGHASWSAYPLRVPRRVLSGDAWEGPRGARASDARRRFSQNDCGRIDHA